VTVITQEEITALLGLERQRTLAGCDQANCTAELAGALGADGVLMAHIARLETVVQLDLKVISASSGERRATFATRVGRDVEILDALDEAARSLALQLLGASAAPAQRSWLFLPVGLVGLAAAGVGVGFALDANSVHAQLLGQKPLSGAPGDLVTQGKRSQAVGVTGLAVGGAAVAAAVVLLFWPSEAPKSVALVPTGPGVALVGSWP
jgi:hypothetical protein